MTAALKSEYSRRLVVNAGCFVQLFPMLKTTGIGSPIMDAQTDGLIDHIAIKVDTNVLSVPMTILPWITRIGGVLSQ